jgi:branched-chain amino acid transport system ATP-binding protein
MKLLEVHNLRKYFGGFCATAGITLAFEEGELCSIIGPNGAGKTTFFNLISGRLKPTSGSILFRGEDITGHPPHRIVQQGIGRSFQISNIFRGFTVFQNVRMAILCNLGKTMNLFADTNRMADITGETFEILRMVNLENQAHRKASILSYGDQRKLEIAIALANKPTLLLLDEPTAGMNPEETADMVQFVRDIASMNHATIIFVEHDMNIVFSISQRIVVLHQGSILADGAPEDIRRNKDVKSAYLGE